MSQARIYALINPVAIAAKIKAAGGPAVDPTQASGEASADGVTLSWSVVRDQVLITIVQKPWMIAYGVIWSHVDAIFG